ncbi:MAG: hypothetical protein QOF77_1921 [Solirubrobacteraceae bacterium]|nr:hypothetical protein [Solirubrobacteraceae bacterium]
MSAQPLEVRSGVAAASAGLASRWPSLAAGAAALGLIVALAFENGGYFPPSYLGAGAIAFAVLGLLLILRPPRYKISTRAHVGLAALAAFTAWTALSAGWSVAPADALAAAQRDLTYLGLFGLALVAAGSGRHAGLLVWGVLVTILVIGVAGLISRLYPDLILAPAPLAIYRLSYPLSYWNAYGAICAMGAVLAVGLAGDARTPVPLRGLSAAAAIVLAVAIYFSLSRGAWLAAVVAVVVLVIIAPHRGSLLVSVVLVGAAAALAIVRLRHFPALVKDPRAGAGQLREGHAFGPELLGLAGGGAVLGTLLAAARAPLLRASARLAPGRAVVAAAAVLAAGLALGGLAAESRPIGAFVDRQWSDFLHPVTVGVVGPARLGDLKGTRSDVYRVALDGFAENPVIGAGAGSFQSQWFRVRRVDQQLVNAHSLELETLDELGVVGGMLLLVFIGSIAAAAIRARRTTGSLTAGQASAATGALVVWLVHSAVDWDWQMSALTGVAVVLAASLYPFGRVRRRQVSRRGTAAGERGTVPLAAAASPSPAGAPRGAAGAGSAG